MAFSRSITKKDVYQYLVIINLIVEQCFPTNDGYSVVCYNPSYVVKRFRDKANAEASYELSKNRYTTYVDSDDSQLDTENKNPCIVPGMIGYICEIWQSAMTSNEQALESPLIAFAWHNNPLRRGVTFFLKRL